MFQRCLIFYHHFLCRAVGGLLKNIFAFNRFLYHIYSTNHMRVGAPVCSNSWSETYLFNGRCSPPSTLSSVMPTWALFRSLCTDLKSDWIEWDVTFRDKVIVNCAVTVWGSGCKAFLNGVSLLVSSFITLQTTSGWLLGHSFTTSCAHELYTVSALSRLISTSLSWCLYADG